MMRVTLLQMDIRWGEPTANCRRAEELMEAHPDSDLYILPEMFATGFATQPEGMAEEAATSPSLRWMKQTAAQRQCALCGSLAVEEDGHCYNRLYFVKPDGEVTAYDKRHLFTYGGEHLHYTPGEQRTVVTWQGVRILLLVCYDLRFPVWSRNREDYDLIIYTANWPASRRRAWDILVRARAIENQCYVAAVNRTGDDPQCSYNGGSCLIDAYGKEAVLCEEGKECAVTADINLEKLTAFRQKFPVLKDRD